MPDPGKTTDMFFIINILFYFNFAHAATVNPGTLLRSETLSDVKIPVSSEVKLDLFDPPMSLKLTGAGIREKRVLVFPVNVYYLESYATDPKSIENSKAKVLKMTLLRDLSSGDIKKSFSERLKANGIDPNLKAFQNIFAEMPEKIKKGDIFYFIATQEGGNQSLSIEFPSKNFSVKDPQIASQFWKIWFGKTDDDHELDRLKSELKKNS